MISESRIEKLTGIKLIGVHQLMSFAENKTQELWQQLMPRIEEIKDRDGKDLYSVEEFEQSFFENITENKNFTKWAAVKVKSFKTIPDRMESLSVPEGHYAVFTYRGKPSEASDSYRYIFTEWLPQSEFLLDNRPHFALMGDKYKGEHPDSEEELWIPVSGK